MLAVQHDEDGGGDDDDDDDGLLLQIQVGTIILGCLVYKDLNSKIIFFNQKWDIVHHV